MLLTHSFPGQVSKVPKKADGEISITADVWSANNFDSYIAMTAHWIGEDGPSNGLSLKTTLIAFHCLTSRHTGEQLTKTILQLIDCAVEARRSLW